jgi:hypothetical protein
MQCVCGSACVWQLGGGSCQTQRPHLNFFTIRKEQYLINGFVRSRYQNKNNLVSRDAEPLANKAYRAGKILPAPKFCQEKTDISRGETKELLHNLLRVI